MFLLLVPFSNAQVRESPEDILRFGFSAYRDGFYDPAAEAFGKYLRLRPLSSRGAIVRFLYAEALRKSERYREAIVAYRKFLSRHGKDGRGNEVRFRLAELLEKAGDRAGAMRSYALVGEGELQAEALYRISEFHLKEKKWKEGASTLQKFIALAPEDPRLESALYERARALDHAKEYMKAEEGYRIAVERFPKSERTVAAVRRLVFLRLRLKRFAETEQSIKELLKRVPKEIQKPDIQLAMAASYFGQEKFAQAAQAFEKVLSLKISNAERQRAEQAVAHSWWNAKKFPEAMKAYGRLIQKSPKETPFLVRYLHSLSQSEHCGPSGTEELRLALETMKRGASLMPRDQLLLSNCLQKAGLKVEAAENFEAVSRAVPNRPIGIAAGLRLAEMMEASSLGKEAAVQYQRLLAAIGSLNDTDKKEHGKLVRGVYEGVLRAAAFHFQGNDCGSALGFINSVPRDFVPAKGRAEIASLQGECDYRNGRFKSAEIHFGKVLVGGRRPELAARARFRLATIAKKRGDKEESLRRFQEALPFLPLTMQREARLEAGQLLRDMGKISESHIMLSPFAQDEGADQERRRDIWLLLAQDAAASEKWGEADKALTNWDTLRPPDPQAGLTLWVTVLFRAGKCPQAIKMTDRALYNGGESGSVKPSVHTDLLRMKASCLIEIQSNDEAERVLEQIADREPEDPEVIYQLGSLFEQGGKNQKAVQTYTAFLQKFPKHSQVPGVALRMGFLEAGAGNRESAIKAYQIAIRSSDPQIAEPARYHLALDMEERGKLEDALAEYEKLAVQDLALSKWGRSASWRAAALREKRGEWKRAFTHYDRIARVSSVGSNNSDALGKEARQAAVRAEKIKAYLAAVQTREEKMRNREPLIR